jgi:hypothetical protein
MPTKKERIVELERKVAELEDKTKRNIFIPYIQPEQPPISIMSNWSICFNCGTRFQGNAFKVTWTASTGSGKEQI